MDVHQESQKCQSNKFALKWHIVCKVQISFTASGEETPRICGWEDTLIVIMGWSPFNCSCGTSFLQPHQLKFSGHYHRDLEEYHHKRTQEVSERLPTTRNRFNKIPRMPGNHYHFALLLQMQITALRLLCPCYLISQGPVPSVHSTQWQRNLQ